MFVELGTFVNEKELYNQKVAELKNTVVNPEELSRALEEERLRFKGVNRKYLPTAISVIKNTFQVDYSLYKIGRDVDANFKTIETNVNKTQSEIATEMNQFVQQANGMGLSEEQVNKLNLAIDIIMTYVDDTAVNEDQNKAFYLNHSKVVASSLDLPVTQKIQEPVVTDAIQYNPYANQPLNLNNQVVSNQQPIVETKEPLVDPFANLYNSTPVQNNVPVQPMDNSMNQQVNNGYQATQSQPVYSQPTAPAVQQNQFIQTPEQVVVPVIPVQSTFVQQQNAQVMTEQPAFVQQSVVGVQPQMMQTQTQMYVQPAVSQPVPQVIPQATAATSQVVMPDTNLLPDDSFVSGKEKNGVIAQIICAVLVPIMVAISSAIVYAITELDFVSELFTSMPKMLNVIASCLFIGTVCLLCAGPIIKVAKSRTVYLERFMVPVALMSLPISWFFLKIVSDFQPSSMEMAIHFATVLLVSFMLYFPFVTLLFVRAFVNSDNSKTVRAPIWSIFDKIGMFLVIYTIIIPAVYIVVSLFGTVEILDKILSVIYFMDSPSISEHLDKVFLVVAPIMAGLIMVTRSMIIKRVGSAE